MNRHFMGFLMAAATFFFFSATAQAQDVWIAPEEAKAISNPNNANKKSIKNGEALYKQSCALCHGDIGKGDGIGAQALNPKPADHTAESVQSQTDGEIFWKISNGRGQMVGWDPIIAESDRWDIVNYIRTLKGK